MIGDNMKEYEANKEAYKMIIKMRIQESNVDYAAWHLLNRVSIRLEKRAVEIVKNIQEG